MTDDIKQFRLSFQDEDLDAVLAAVKEAGATDAEAQSTRGMSGIELAVIGAIAVPTIVNLIIAIADRWSCGVRVDTRTGSLIGEKDCTIPRGSVLVITENDSQLHRADKMSMPGFEGLLK